MGHKAHRPLKLFSLKDLLIFLLFAAPTIQYRVELGAFSFALMEPIVLLVSVMLLIHQAVRYHRLSIPKEPFAFLFATLTLWAFTIRPWASNWQNGLSDVRDWAIPLLGFITLSTTIRRGWLKWITIFMILVWLNAWLGIYQHFTNSFRPFISELAAYKTGFTLSPEENRLALASFAVGLFSHPNGFAMYLFAGLMVALGEFYKSSKKLPFFIVIILPIALSLYWTYAKATLLVLAGLIPFTWLERRLSSNKTFWAFVSMGLIAGLMIIWQITKYIPPALLVTFWWRIGLWNTGLITLGNFPHVLLFGNGLDIFANSAYYGQPHNLYLYIVLQYGLPGLLIVILLALYILKKGNRLRRSGWMRSEPVLATLWLGLLGYFAIGLVESNLMGVENRAIFMTLVACFAGLAREAADGNDACKRRNNLCGREDSTSW
jgi:hypothetical protein